MILPTDADAAQFDSIRMHIFGCAQGFTRLDLIVAPLSKATAPQLASVRTIMEMDIRLDPRDCRGG